MSTPNAVGGGVKKEDKNGAGDTGNNDDNIKSDEMQPLCRGMASTPTPLTTGPGSKMASHTGLLEDGCCQGGNAVLLNVGGQRHEVLRKNFDRYPGSRLWKVMRADSVEEILAYCDRYRVAASNDDVPEYFFDRNYTGFASLLDAYRTGHLHVCSVNCAVITRDDLAYWGIDDLLMEPCCAVKYYPEIEICTNELDMEEDEKRKEEERQRLEDFGPSTLGRTRKYLWDLFEYPQTSRGAQFIALWSLFMIVVSTACFILSCIYGEDSLYLGSKAAEAQARAKESTDPKLDITSKEDIEKRETFAKIILYVDYFTAVYFTIEYVVRFACTPARHKFFVQPMNLIDLFAILPYFINIILDQLISEFHIIGKAGKVIRLVRVTKVLRVFKLVRHFAGLQSLFYTIRRASRELGLLLTLVFVMVLTFSSLVYFAEKEDSTNQWSFMDSFWWGLLTITTVGNGVDKPDTPAGKFVGSMCAVLAIFTLILPIPIVVNSFSAFYRNRLWRNEVAIKRRERDLAGTGGKEGGVELNGVTA